MKKNKETDDHEPDNATDAIRESAAASTARAQKPSLGRQVRFRSPEQPHEELTAVINQITSEGQVAVCAFDPVFGPRNYMTSGEGTEPGQWSWPPRD